MSLHRIANLVVLTYRNMQFSAKIRAMSAEAAILSDLDLAIIRSLQVWPRAPFRLLAQLLEASEQTVARRYNRLRRAGVLRVTAVVDPVALGQSNWMVRVQCKPSGAPALARGLALRDDVGWVSIVGGGAEVDCVLRSWTAQAREELLLQRLPRTAPVLGITAAMELHPFVGGGADDWAALAGQLRPEQERQLRAESGQRRPDRSTIPASHTLEPADTAILDLLAADGRASYAALAAAAEISEGRAARRLRMLLETGVAYLDVDLSAPALGFAVQAVLWLSVPPAELETAGRALAGLVEVPYAAAISGSHNLHATVICRDTPALYRFITERVGRIAGVSAIEVVPLLRTVKQAGTLVTDGLLTG